MAKPSQSYTIVAPDAVVAGKVTGETLTEAEIAAAGGEVAALIACGAVEPTKAASAAPKE